MNRYFPKTTMLTIEHSDGHTYSYERTDYDPNRWTLYFDGERVREVGSTTSQEVAWAMFQTVAEKE